MDKDYVKDTLRCVSPRFAVSIDTLPLMVHPAPTITSSDKTVIDSPCGIATRIPSGINDKVIARPNESRADSIESDLSRRMPGMHVEP